MKTALPALLLALLAGCAALQPPAVRPGPTDEPPTVARSSGPRGVSGGVFSAESISLTSDARAYRVGDVDLITTILSQQDLAQALEGQLVGYLVSEVVNFFHGFFYCLMNKCN